MYIYICIYVYIYIYIYIYAYVRDILKIHIDNTHMCMEYGKYKILKIKYGGKEFLQAPVFHNKYILAFTFIFYLT